MITVEAENLRQVQEALKDTPYRVNVILARSINRAATNARANMAKTVVKEYTVKSSDVKSTVNVVNATPYKTYATVKSKGQRIDLVDFKLTPKVLFKGQHDYSVQVHRSGGLKRVPGFAAQSNKWGLFMRTGASRFPIKRLMGPSVPQMIGNKNVIEEIENQAQSLLNERLQSELNYELNVRNKS